MGAVERLLKSFGTALILFGVTMTVYTLGMTVGACTWSPQLVSIVGLNDLMVAAVLWMFWD